MIKSESLLGQPSLLTKSLFSQTSFLLDISNHQDSIRNVAVVGHLHHGKTSLIDMLIYETHKMDWDVDKPVSEYEMRGLLAIM